MSYFNHENLNIYYEEIGSGEPLLLINGLGGDTRGWAPLIEHLKNKFHVISYDMRCAGQSDKPKEQITIHQLAEEALALIQHLGLKRVHVLAHSMGGMIAMDLALNHPDLIDKLFLISTAPSLNRPYAVSEKILTLFHRIDVSPELLAEVYETVFGTNFKKKISIDDYIKARMKDTNPQPTQAYLNQLRATELFDIYDSVAKIFQPACIVVGDQDKIIPPQNSKWLSEKIPNSKLLVLKGIGHMLPIEATDELSKIVEEICL
ncbi:MAG: alpha/beta hydrolase [Pseudomonadota bacterium]